MSVSGCCPYEGELLPRALPPLIIIEFLLGVLANAWLHPHHRLNSASAAEAAGVAGAMWVLTVSLNAHFLKVPQHLAVGNAMKCESFLVCLTVAPASLWSRTASFVIIFLVPLALNLVCSLRIISELRRRHLDHHGNMKRTISSLAMVVVVFVVCFLPSKVFQVLIWVKVWSQCESVDVMNGIFYATLTLTYLNSILDPVLYYFSSPNIQRVCRQLVRLQSTEGMVDTGEDGT
ncbi:hydroxycarboxylic acid receptor 2-like [Clupea harengus]|uniref:Hydroxycarboxylic acid receptor 2-like n=1 Tax=Clupea harengus TaxID=7950 RepID=A0A6P3VMD4_CLUHA|nr:hydroxycarboxylic acid receptor 2-like [Clupea harengus]